MSRRKSLAQSHRGVLPGGQHDDETEPPPSGGHRRVSRCWHCKMLLAAVALAAVATISLMAFAHGGSLTAAYQSFSFGMMRLFRDLSRAKARRRRFGQHNALMPLLMQSEEPLPLADASLGLSITLEELAEYDGRLLPDSSERAPLFLAIHGRIYDVSAGWGFYGPGQSYHKLVGKDATRAFCTGCLEPDCLVRNTDGLTEKQLKEAYRWIELYEQHDKYTLVGMVRTEHELTAEAEAVEAETLGQAQVTATAKNLRSTPGTPAETAALL